MIPRLLPALLLVLTSTATIRTAAADEPRQAYGKWQFSEQHGYHFTTFRFRPKAGPCEACVHYCIVRKDDPHYVYYFNPAKKEFWARFDSRAEEGKQFSVLPVEARKPTLAEIAEKEFPAPAAAPVLPEADDDTAVEPPDDLPRG